MLVIIIMIKRGREDVDVTSREELDWNQVIKVDGEMELNSEEANEVPIIALMPTWRRREAMPRNIRLLDR
jgi:hypothetical protein